MAKPEALSPMTVKPALIPRCGPAQLLPDGDLKRAGGGLLLKLEEREDQVHHQDEQRGADDGRGHALSDRCS